jgi:hypothetical protein
MTSILPEIPDKSIPEIPVVLTLRVYEYLSMLQ